MTKLEVSFAVGDKVIDSVDIKTVGFIQFASYVTTAYNMKAPTSYEGRLKRLRMEQQVSYMTNGKATPFSTEEILRIPIVAARKITKGIDNSTEDQTAGKIIREGDGVSTAIAFELGTPIPTGQGKEPIKELEFIAKTYGDIEDVLSANDGLTQTIALIRTVAKPVHTTLMTLPSWAADQITVADGMAIASTVTTRFLGDEQEDSELN